MFYKIYVFYNPINCNYYKIQIIIFTKNLKVKEIKK